MEPRSGTSPTAAPASVVDRLLPPGWDTENHLAVLAGGNCAAIAAELQRRGQRRTFVWLPKGAPAGDLPEACTPIRSAHELRLAILHAPGDPPRNAVVRSFGDPRVDRAQLEVIAGVLKDSVRALALHQSTSDRVGPVWVRNALKNLPRLAERPSIAALDGAAAGRPCVLVSPGPSLDRNVATLAGLGDRALIVTSSHALAPLRAAGVRPHLVLVADPSPFMARHLEDCEPRDLGALAVAATCDPSVNARPFPLTFSFAGNCAADAWLYEALGEDAALDTGGSVACSAFSLAVRMGCDPIVLIGQDLALDGERYYAQGCVDSPTRLVIDGEAGTVRQEKRLPTGPDGALEQYPGKTDRLLRAPCWSGGEVLTTRMFTEFRGWLETRAADLAGRVRVVNATEGGVHIAGMEHLPLAEVSAEWSEPFDALAPLTAAASSCDAATRREALHARAGLWLAAIARGEKLAGEAKDLARRAERKPQLVDKLRSRERELSRALGPVGFLSLLAQEEIRAAQRAGRGASGLAGSLRASRRLHEVVLRAARELGPRVEAARSAL